MDQHIDIRALADLMKVPGEASDSDEEAVICFTYCIILLC